MIDPEEEEEEEEGGGGVGGGGGGDKTRTRPLLMRLTYISLLSIVSSAC